MKIKKPLKIWMVSSEFGRMRSTGGLADAVHGLSQGLTKLGHHVNIIVPAHSGTLAYCLRGVREGVAISHFAGIKIPVGSSFEQADVFRASVPAFRGSSSRFTIYLIDNEAGTRFGSREKTYGYKDDPARFLFFNRAVLEFYKQITTNNRFRSRRGKLLPQIIHTHDWPAAFVPYFFRHMEGNLPLPLVHSIHNLGYGVEKGFVPDDFFRLTLEHNPWCYSPDGLEFFGKIDATKAALRLADKIVTVSHEYKEQILAGETPEPGNLYNGMFQARNSDIHGILNGIPDEYTPQALHQDGVLPASFSEEDLSGKIICRHQLQNIFGLNKDDNSMLITLTGRWAAQKGTDLFLKTVNQLLGLPVQLVLVGSGDEALLNTIMALNTQYPGRYSAKLFENGNGARLESLAFAGADASLVPSRYEPCGLVQLKAQTLGCLPIVNPTGGLTDTVADLQTGFVLKSLDENGIIEAVLRALKRHTNNQQSWQAMISQAMAQDYSWKRAAQQYVKEIYQAAIARVVAT